MYLSDVIDQYLDHCTCAKRLAKNTVRAYRSDLTDIKKFIGRDVQDLKKETIKDYINHLTKERELKATTVRRRIASMRVFFAWLVRNNNALESNPMAELEYRIKLPRRLPRSLSSDQIAAILNAARICAFGPQYNTQKKVESHTWLTGLVAIELMFATGIRIGELTAIDLGDLDLENGVIRIHGKGSRERIVFIPTNTLEQLLRRYLRERTAIQPENDLLLIGKEGRPASSQFIRSLVRTLGISVGIANGLTPHMFRHSAATQLLEKGVGIRVIQRLLGHESITTTQIYAHVSDSHLRDEIEKAHRALGLV